MSTQRFLKDPEPAKPKTPKPLGFGGFRSFRGLGFGGVWGLGGVWGFRKLRGLGGLGWAGIWGFGGEGLGFGL